jgi:hypothetical protein
MGNSVGRVLPVSPYRRLVTELMYASAKVPSVSADRRMDLRPIAAARQTCSPRPSWCGLFSKAFGIVGRDFPEMRRSYMQFPRPWLYEHPHSIVSLNVERETALERIVLYCLIRAPENRSIAEIEELIRKHKEDPLETLRPYQRSVRMARLPWPIRPFAFWGSLNFSGRRRCHNFGTFGISSIGAQGAGLLNITPILTTTIHFGLFDEQNRLDVRLSWDHRVMDGATVARSLVAMEETLNRELVRELTGFRRKAA